MHDNGLIADNLTLAMFLHDCFLMAVWDKDKNSWVAAPDDRLHEAVLMQPPVAGKTIDPTRTPLPRDHAKAAEMMRRAARDQMIAPGSMAAYVREVEERRSAVIAAIGESAAALATAVRLKNNEYDWPARPAVGIDARDFGLTFVATLGEIAALFPDALDNALSPPKSKFTIATRIRQGTETAFPSVPEAMPVCPQQAYLLNPPSRFFSVAQPKLAGVQKGELPTAELTKNGIELRWDLEPHWEASKGPYHDPEYLLRHYRIRRVVEDFDSELPLYELKGVKTKSGSPLALATFDEEVEGKTVKRAVWQPLAMAAHFVDTLDNIAEIEPKLAEALLHRGDDPAVAWARAMQQNTSSVTT